MARLFARRLLAFLAVLLPILTACEQVDDISGVAEMSQYQAAPTFMVNGKPKKAQLVRRGKWASSPAQYALDYVMPHRDGELRIGKYQLDIPRGAVKSPTIFMMKVVDDGYVSVELKAWDLRLQTVSQFQVPLRLTIPYDEGEDQLVADPSKLLLANTESEAILELVNVAVDRKDRTVTGSISHFSIWSLAKELSPGID